MDPIPALKAAPWSVFGGGAFSVSSCSAAEGTLDANRKGQAPVIWPSALVLRNLVPEAQKLTHCCIREGSGADPGASTRHRYFGGQFQHEALQRAIHGQAIARTLRPSREAL